MTEKMNALRNKKGFTLIEMLVVIAIIAVLVSIAIPVVSNSTAKAGAAANAANLRSFQAEATTLVLSGTPDASGNLTGANVTLKKKDTDYDVTMGTNAPVSEKVGTYAGGDQAVGDYDPATNSFTFTYGGYGIKSFSDFADGTVTELDK